MQIFRKWLITSVASELVGKGSRDSVTSCSPDTYLHGTSGCFRALCLRESLNFNRYALGFLPVLRDIKLLGFSNDLWDAITFWYTWVANNWLNPGQWDAHDVTAAVFLICIAATRRYSDSAFNWISRANRRFPPLILRHRFVKWIAHCGHQLPLLHTC